ncbi:MAG: SpoIID/LytB domain-containing protein [Bacteroidales bacterium]|jgi:SpoIID/LytB domain protein|nr:SpoIID/LytB domain-containing protein [Bacteroidales bacterium]
MNQLTSEPDIEAGILNAELIHFTLTSRFNAGTSGIISGRWSAETRNGSVVITDGKQTFRDFENILISPCEFREGSFTVHSVVIGVGFHWERKEDQIFRGSLKFVMENGRITLVNRLPVEEYLVSVISSEMKESSSTALLKAHAVISRGWLLAQIAKRGIITDSEKKYSTSYEDEAELTRWYDREDHALYDVCADDHCQRYQGITRAGSAAAAAAVMTTYGQVLMHEGSICDTRFYKCCGGRSELFANTWEPEDHPYLASVYDAKAEVEDFNPVQEDAAKRWIDSSPDVFCNTSDASVLSQVLNDYDQETPDFFRWKLRYSQEELRNIIRSRSGIDYGEILELVPLERGSSGRIIRLKIHGTLKSRIIGKELEIRKTLSRSHLYSSCFYVEKHNEDGVIYFDIKGAGWGHGVGLCQIGAAVMGARGYDYDAILSHYFRGAELKRLYSESTNPTDYE